MNRQNPSSRSSIIDRSIILGSLVLALCACNRGRNGPAPARSRAPEALSDYILNTAPPISHPLDIVFDDQVVLLGYDIEPAGAIPRAKEINLTLYWKLTASLDGNWKLLTHVVDPFGVKLSDLNNAGPLRAGKRGHPRFPPSRWSVGKVYVDRLSFKLPSRLAARTVSVMAGVYTNDSSQMRVSKGQADQEQRALVAKLDVAVENPGATLVELEPAARIVVDGRLSEAAWDHATVLGPFLDTDYSEPARTRLPPSGQARMLWNRLGLFLGYEVKSENLESGALPSAWKPGLWSGDAVVLVVDPDGDGQSDYELAIDPGNQVLALKRALNQRDRPEGAPLATWRAKVESSVVVKGTLDRGNDRDEGYVVEAMIPWQSFEQSVRRPPARGSSWKLNLYAVERTTAVGWSPPLAKRDFHEISRVRHRRVRRTAWTLLNPSVGTSGT